jgi:hypothetical protein
MGIAIVTWYVLILWSINGCVQNIGAYEFKIIHVMDVAICEQCMLTLLKTFALNILQFLQFSDKI